MPEPERNGGSQRHPRREAGRHGGQQVGQRSCLDHADLARGRYTFDGNGYTFETYRVATHPTDLERECRKIIRSVREGVGIDHWLPATAQAPAPDLLPPNARAAPYPPAVRPPGPTAQAGKRSHCASLGVKKRASSPVRSPTGPATQSPSLRETPSHQAGLP